MIRMRCQVVHLLNSIKRCNHSAVQAYTSSTSRNCVFDGAIKMHHNQVTMILRDAREMIYRQFPQYDGIDIEQFHQSSGTVNAIFRIGTKATARFPLQNQYGQEQFIRHLQMEATAMAEFADSCSFLSPRPIGIGQPSLSYPLPWSVQTWVEGSTNTPDHLARSRIFTSDLVRLIKIMRSASVRGRTFDGQGRGGRIHDRAGWMEICLKNSDNLLDVPHLQSLWDFFRKLPPSEGPDVMSHKDLTPMNILVRDEHIIGVLDTGSYGPADRALDLVALWHMLGSEQRQIARKMLDLRTIEWCRGAAWAFDQAIGLVWYYQQSNPTMAAFGRTTLRRLLEDEELQALLHTSVQ